MFNELMKEAQKYYAEPQFINLLDDPCYNVNLFKNKMEQIDSLSDTELVQIIRKNYSFIFNLEDKTYLKLFMNERFLNSLIDVVTYNPLSVTERITCNAIIYEYLVLLNGDNYDIKSLLIRLAKVVNRDLVNILMGMRLSGELAAYIAFTRNGSIDEKINVKRINFLLSQQNMEYSDMKNIYRILFGNSILFLFTHTMFDAYQLEDWMTNEFIQNHNNISRIVLEMLEDSPYPDIRMILSSYAKDFAILHTADRSKIRFSLRDYSKDYPRINYMIYYLAQTEGVYVP